MKNNKSINLKLQFKVINLIIEQFQVKIHEIKQNDLISLQNKAINFKVSEN